VTVAVRLSKTSARGCFNSATRKRFVGAAK